MKWPRAIFWKCAMKSRLIAAPPAAPRIGTNWRTAFSERTTPVLEARLASIRTRIGAPSCTIPLCATNSAASPTARARTVRTAK